MGHRGCRGLPNVHECSLSSRRHGQAASASDRSERSALSTDRSSASALVRPRARLNGSRGRRASGGTTTGPGDTPAARRLRKQGSRSIAEAHPDTQSDVATLRPRPAAPCPERGGVRGRRSHPLGAGLLRPCARYAPADQAECDRRKQPVLVPTEAETPMGRSREMPVRVHRAREGADRSDRPRH